MKKKQKKIRRIQNISIFTDVLPQARAICWGILVWISNYLQRSKAIRPSNHVNIASVITGQNKPSAWTYYHTMRVYDRRAMQDDDWSYNQPVDGDEIVSMCLVDNDHVDSQPANAAGELPNKPHEWMMSNLLSPCSRTLGMQARNDSGGCGKRIVSGL